MVIAADSLVPSARGGGPPGWKRKNRPEVTDESGRRLCARLGAGKLLSAVLSV